MNSDNTQPTDGQEKLRRQSEAQARLEDAIRWGMFEGGEPSPEPMRQANEDVEQRLQAGPDGDEPCRR